MEKLISKQLLAKAKVEVLVKSSLPFSEVKAKFTVKKVTFATSVFLSHKHSDTEVIEEVIALLSSLNVSVYVDWQDYGISKSTDGSTALRIKEKIKENDKFILLATEDAIVSKWCNWELGYGDSCKYPKNLAIMPITNSEDSNFTGTEYLQIYPVITSQYYYHTGFYYVEYGDSKITLENWLNGKLNYFKRLKAKVKC